MTDTQQTGHRPVDGRTLHYGEFYGVKPLPPDDGRPLAFVLGTCQSEALRVLLDSAPAATLRTVRVPPVYELEDDELPHLRQLLALADSFRSHQSGRKSDPTPQVAAAVIGVVWLGRGPWAPTRPVWAR